MATQILCLVFIYKSNIFSKILHSNCKQAIILFKYRTKMRTNYKKYSSISSIGDPEFQNGLHFNTCFLGKKSVQSIN